MPLRARLALALTAACALLIALAVGIADRGSAGAPAGSFAGALSPPGIPPQDFTLTDQDGAAVRLSDFAGRVTVLTFLYTSCRDSCPLLAQQIRGALDQLGHDVPTLAVSVDPAGDTPAGARAFLLKQSMTGRMRYLLGTRAQLQPIWRAFGIAPQTAAARRSDHSIDVVLIDRSGRRRVGFAPDNLTPEGLAHDIVALERQPAPAQRPRRQHL